MANDDYEDREARLWPDPIELMKSLVANSPEMNVKVALINAIEYLAGDEDDDSSDSRTIDANDLMEVIASSITYLHHHVGEDDFEEEEHPHITIREKKAAPAPTAEELMRLFREQLGETNTTEEK